MLQLCLFLDLPSQHSFVCLWPVLLDFKNVHELLNICHHYIQGLYFLQYTIGLPNPQNKKLSGYFVGFLKVAGAALFFLFVCIISANLLQTKEAHQRFARKGERCGTQNKIHRYLE